MPSLNRGQRGRNYAASNDEEAVVDLKQSAELERQQTAMKDLEARLDMMSREIQDQKENHLATASTATTATTGFMQATATTVSVVKAPKLDQLTTGAKQPLLQKLASKTPWGSQDCVDVDGHILQRQNPVHVPSHTFCMLIYIGMLAAYTAFMVIRKETAPPEKSFSSQESVDFGPMDLKVTVDCTDCTYDPTGTKNFTYRVKYDYEGVPQCKDVGSAAFMDQDAYPIKLCRSSDDIRDKTGVEVHIHNISKRSRVHKGLGMGAGRATVFISSGDLNVTTPVQFWHEKTLLLGLEVTRDKEDCMSPADCNLNRGLYLASMQYDGHCSWGQEHWGGGIVNIRMLKFANVYTIVPSISYMDIFASIGGASGLLIGVLGALRKMMELVLSGASKKTLAKSSVGAVKEACSGG